MDNREDKPSRLQLAAIQYLILVIFLGLGLRLWDLQIASSGKYETLAERNRIRTVKILAPRGKILDRYGRIIVDNYPSFSALMMRDQRRDLDLDLPLIARGLHLQVADIRRKLRRFAAEPRYTPMTLKDDLTPDELAFVESHRNELPELDVIMAHRRLYPRNGFMAHVIGYVGEVSESMLDSPEYDLYEPGDVVGRSGLEAEYNDMLMGQDGQRRTVVNSRGKELAELSAVPPVAGQPLKLTIDLDLQMAAEEALEGHRGAIVALNPRNGEVLAMASRPSFDPNDFAVRISRKEWRALVSDPGKPLLNKAIQAQLAPGSVFKIIMAVAGLQEGIAQNMHVQCDGGKTFYGRFYKCWISALHRTHGDVDITKAIYQSCDSFFYTLGEKLGIERIARYAMAFGLGQKTGIDLPDEASGVVPSEEWKIRNFKQRWFPGETIDVSIGQGPVTVTPIQIARAIGGIAMGGVLYRPHLAFPDDLPAQYRPAVATLPEVTHVAIAPANLALITDAMTKVVSPLGTAPRAQLKDIDFAGKTGSAQVISNQLKKRLGQKGKSAQYNDNGWFAGFTPHQDPEIVVAVLVEQGQHGELAGELAAQVIKAYVEKQRHIPVKVAQSHGQPRPIEMAAVWSVPDGAGGERLHSGKFLIPAGNQGRETFFNQSLNSRMQPAARMRPAPARPGL